MNFYALIAGTACASFFLCSLALLGLIWSLSFDKDVPVFTKLCVGLAACCLPLMLSFMALEAALR